MKLVEFFKEVDSGKLSLDKQIDFFDKNEVYECDEIFDAIKFIKKINKVHNDSFECLDVCGTGGNTESRLNTSTIIAFLLSFKGIPVIKHGGKGMSGRIGSFDFLDKLGINATKFDKSIFKKMKIEFIFAPLIYESFKSVTEARKEYGKFSVMNVLGPLLNPMNPKFQIIGCTNRKYLKIIAETCFKLGKKRAFIYSSNSRDDIFLDQNEISGYLLEKNKIELIKFQLKDFGLKNEIYYPLPADTIKFQKKLIKGKLEYDDVYVKHIALNACLAEFTFSNRRDFTEMMKENINIIQSGILNEKINDYRRLQNSHGVLNNIINNKIFNIHPKVSLKNALSKSGTNIIAEIKFKSPSNKNGFKNSKMDAIEIAKIYSKQKKIVAISHVVESKYFAGNSKNIKVIKKNLPNIPVLYKDFIINKNQILIAHENNADVILLIQKILQDDEIIEFTKFAHSLNLEVVLELESDSLIKKYEKFSIDILGLNSRNLNKYKSNQNVFETKLNSTKPVIYESGIINLKDLNQVKGFNGYLIGTAFMNAENIDLKIKELSGKSILKICGLRKLKIAKKIDSLNLDMIGLNFIESSKRKTNLADAIKFSALIKRTLKVGLFDKDSIHLANEYVQKCNLDFIQITDDIDDFYIVDLKAPIIKCFNLNTKNDIQKINEATEQLIIVDGAKSGSGNTVDLNLLKKVDRPFILAGGLNHNNIKNFKEIHPLCIGFDIATGIEENNEQSLGLIENLISIL